MLIKLKDYERIFEIISGVVESEDGDPAYACIYYSLFGAAILVDHFELDAKVRCGLAAYHLGDDNEVLCFGELTDAGVTSSSEGFHCWVEADGWLLDFMAPNFGKLKNTYFTARPKMFQKRLSDMAGHPNEMSHAGEFFFHHNPELSKKILSPFIVCGWPLLCKSFFVILQRLCQYSRLSGLFA